jgi:acyl-coenzyme A synthetase/AMP-(fatty) acid ligase/acyl carrier protein
LALLYSPSSSGAVRDIFGALLNGACLYPFPIKEKGFAPLARWLRDNHITIYNSAASVFREFVTVLTEEDKFDHLRLIHVGSETIYKREVEGYKKYFAEDCVFVARYGTSEISPIRQFVIDKKTEIDGGVVPAGYKVVDTEVIVIGEDGQTVEDGRVGEIAVRSPYLSPGYWRNSELTKRAFVNGAPGAGERIYRTGDMGLLRPDGCLLYLGRKDFQLKVRGYRVEISEVEGALLDIEGVQEAAVVAKEGRPGEWQLIAYVAMRPPLLFEAKELRRTLMNTLPDYMVPVAFEFLDSLPKTATGKVDRNALPPPRRSRPELKEFVVHPSTSTQAMVAKIWADSLSIQEVGIYDRFLDLGGNSLAAMQIVAKVVETFQVELPLRTLLQSTTVAEMAESVESYQRERTGGAQREKTEDGTEEGEI